VKNSCTPPASSRQSSHTQRISPEPPWTRPPLDLQRLQNERELILHAFICVALVMVFECCECNTATIWSSSSGCFRTFTRMFGLSKQCSKTRAGAEVRSQRGGGPKAKAAGGTTPSRASGGCEGLACTGRDQDRHGLPAQREPTSKLRVRMPLWMTSGRPSWTGHGRQVSLRAHTPSSVDQVRGCQIHRIATGATVDPVAPCIFSGSRMNANS